MDKNSLKSGLFTILFPCAVIAAVMIWSEYHPEYKQEQLQKQSQKKIAQSLTGHKTISSMKHPERAR